MSVTSSDFVPGAPRRALSSASELLGSMRFAIALLVVLAIASIIGTVLTQGDPYPNYVNQFGPFWAPVFRSLGLYTVYGSWWFMLILGFLVVSVSLCVTRNGPKMLADMRSWKDDVREGSLRAFGHRGEFAPAMPRAQAAAQYAALAGRLGYRVVVRERDGGTLIAGKRGALSKLGYLFAHAAIVVICIGGLADSNLAVRAQMWLFGKTPIGSSDALVDTIGPEHRLPVWNPTFRGNLWVPEGQTVSSAVLNEPDGALVQDLPFSIQLNRFIVDYYSTGMPKLFASDIVVIDHRTGARVPARVEVNKPFEYDGVSIFQSSFQDGGSRLKLSVWPMTGAASQPGALDGTIGASAPLAAQPGVDGQTVEFADFRAINVENMGDGSGAVDVRGVGRSSLMTALDARLGSGAKSEHPLDLRNVGPSFQYKVRDKDGQAREYNNYMLPVQVAGASMFLAGVRVNPDDPFRYLRIPADPDGSVRGWMRLRAAFEDPALRAAAAQRFAARTVDTQNAALRQNLDESAQRVLALFAGSYDGLGKQPGGATGKVGGFEALAAFIDQSVPKEQQEKAAGLLMRMLEGVTWDLWQLARERAGETDLAQDANSARFVQDSLNAVSDSFLYGAPVYLQLDSYQQVQASVFQLTRAPGRKVVYLGSLLLVAGIFSMFYVRERRLWLWLTDAGHGAAPQTRALFAMSAARRTLDFEHEFARVRDAFASLAAAAGPATREHASAAGEAAHETPEAASPAELHDGDR